MCSLLQLTQDKSCNMKCSQQKEISGDVKATLIGTQATKRQMQPTITNEQHMLKNDMTSNQQAMASNNSRFTSTPTRKFSKLEIQKI